MDGKYKQSEIRETLLSIRKRLIELKASGVRWGGRPASHGKERLLQDLRTEIGDCKRCKLYKTRTNLVFGEGNPDADLMFIGEGPGFEEDMQGRPFVGRAGELLTRIIQAIGLKRSDVYIANVVKCRPPENRNPEPDEIDACKGFVLRQIEIISPKVIVALGTFSAQLLLSTNEKISKLRGTMYDYKGIKLIPTYHPAFLLRNPNMKEAVWKDMQLVIKELKLNPPKRRRSDS
jgi:uracil-DNA glycosylase family 4